MNKIDLFIQDPDVEPGSQVNGFIRLNIVNPIGGVSLRVTGGEHFKCIYMEKGEEEVMEEKGRIMDTGEVPINYEKGVFDVGSYEFPINFTMPSSIPSSFKLVTKNITALITYMVTVTAGDQKVHKPLYVTKKNFPAQENNRECEKTQNLKKLHNCANGTVVVTAILKKKTYQVGQIVRGVGWIDNKKSFVDFNLCQTRGLSQIKIHTAWKFERIYAISWIQRHSKLNPFRKNQKRYSNRD